MGKNTSVVLGEMQEQFIRDQIAKGRYATVSEAIRESVSLLEERELRLAALRAAIDEGDASGDYQELDFDALLAFCRSAIENASGTVLIEGIGGVMVPLDDTHTVLDWIAALNIPAVLVSGSYLGSLSHTLTSLDALRRRNIVIKALVVNETPESTVAVKDTMATLKRFADNIPVFGLPRLPAGGGQHLTLADLAELL